MTARGRRRPVLLRLIAAERMVRGALLIAAGGYLFGHLHSDLGKLADRWIRKLELGGITIDGARALAEELRRPGPVSAKRARQIAGVLDRRLPPRD